MQYACMLCSYLLIYICIIRLHILYSTVFINFFSASHSMSLSEVLPTTAINTVGVHTEALQAIVSEGLAQGPYVGQKALTLPMCNHALQHILYICVFIYVCTYVCRYRYMCICVCICVNVYAYSVCICIYMY